MSSGRITASTSGFYYDQIRRLHSSQTQLQYLYDFIFYHRSLSRAITVTDKESATKAFLRFIVNSVPICWI